jgi:hypothetical protein
MRLPVRVEEVSVRTVIRFFGAVVALALVAPAADGRVLSYAPLTGRVSLPALQSRLGRHLLLVEQTGFGSMFGPAGPVCFACFSQTSRLVLYDAEGTEDPREVSPGGKASRVEFAALFEEGGSVRLLVATNAALPGEEAPPDLSRLLYSPDAGATWTLVPVPSAFVVGGSTSAWPPDRGGRVARERGATVRLGTPEVPFAVLFSGRSSAPAWGLLGIDSAGRIRLLASGDGWGAFLAGTDTSQSRFLLVADSIQPGTVGPGIGGLGTKGLYSVDLSGSTSLVLGFSSIPASLFAFSTADGSTYVEYDSYGGQPVSPFSAPRSVGVVRGGKLTELVTADSLSATLLFAVPSASPAGAWILKRDTGPTVLMSHDAAAGLRTHWSDVTRPEVEAIHAGLSGTRLLLQVHRPRLTPERRFIDPALALWEVGTPSPRGYDELFLNEQSTKGFVHLDVDAAAAGAPFVFDSGSAFFYMMGAPSGGAGGADVVQEWGVVRGSLHQRLVVPASGRTPGVGGSTWRTDLTLRNPEAAPLRLDLRLLPNPETTGSSPAAKLVLEPGEIRIVADVLKTLFGLERGSGAILLVPDYGRSVEATSRTYALAATGTYGMGVPAIDLYASASSSFPVTFSAGLLGPNFRTNVVLTDTSGRGSRVTVVLFPSDIDLSAAYFDLDAPAGAQRQLSGLAGASGLPAGSRGSVRLAPTSGEVVGGLIAIDNGTNDPTWFPPDLPATVARTIPALAHADGANGAAWRSDLYLFNPTEGTRAVFLTVRPWASPNTRKDVSLVLLPHESRVIRDALTSLFGLTGVAQLSFQTDSSPETAEGIRVTSRTYSAAPTGGSYGHPVPPLNSFQSVTGGEALEILGPMATAEFRTNLALVDLMPPGNLTTTPLSIRVEVIDAAGRTADSFTTPLALGGGVQLNDLFRARGLPENLGPVLIRVSPSGGLVAAYATTIDRGTNDPTYYQAQLAARPD